MPTKRRGDARLMLLTAAAMALACAGCDGDRANHQVAQAAHQPTPVTSQTIEKSLAAAQSYLDSQETDKAQAILLTLVARAPKESRAREMLGQSYLLVALEAQARGAEEAVADARRKAYEQYKIAVDLSPQLPGLQHSAGLAAMQAGQPDAALQHFQAAEKLDQRNPQYPLYAAQILIQNRRFDDAIAALDRTLALDPDEPLAHATLAMVALEQERFEQALSHMAQARSLAPDDLGLRAQEAKIHRRRGDPHRALQLLIGLGEADRAREMVAFEIASSFSQLGRPMDAARAWQHVFQSNQVSRRAWLAAVRTGEYLLQAGEREQAALWLQQAQFAAPHAPEVKALEQALRQSRSPQS